MSRFNPANMHDEDYEMYYDSLDSLIKDGEIINLEFYASNKSERKSCYFPKETQFPNIYELRKS